MLSFKEHSINEKVIQSDLPDVHTGVLSSKELLNHISHAKLKSIAKHPYFRNNFHAAMSVGAPIGYRYHRSKGFESVQVAHGPIGEKKPLRRMAEFHLRYSGRSVTNASLYHNWDNERHSQGGLVWRHVKSTQT